MNKLSRYGGPSYFDFDTQWCKSSDVARLEASHTELLEALQMLVRDFADYPAYDRPCLAFDKARAAIAKAEGDMP